MRFIAAGKIFTAAGTGASGFSGDGGPATTATFAKPAGLAFDGAGHLLIADTNNNRLRQVDFTASSLTFGSQIVQTSSSAQSALVFDNGNTSLTLSDISVTGPFSLAASSTCKASAAAMPAVTTAVTVGASCTVSVVFTPVNPGPATGTVTITNNGAGAARVVNLIGTGLPVQVAGPQTITFPAIADMPYGTAPFTLQASSSSGLPITYTVTGPATVSGATLTITGVGAVSVTASQPGNANYAAATPVTRNFNVTPGTLTFKANNQTIPYQTAINPLTYTVTGFAAGDTLANSVTGSVSITTTATNGSLPGIYPITITVGTAMATNYNFVFVPASLTITKVIAAVTESGPAAVTSVQTFTLTATVTGTNGTPTGTVNFVSGAVTLASATLVNGVATATVSNLAAGSYNVVAAYTGDSVYSPANSAAFNIVSTVPPDYSITSTPSTITIPRGQAGLITTTFTPVSGYSGTVQLTCSGLPANVLCTFSPSVLILNGSNTVVQSQLLISTTGLSIAGSAIAGRSVPLTLALLLFAVFSCTSRMRRAGLRRLAVAALCMLAAAGALTGCGVRGSLAAPATFNVTINAADAASKVTHTNVITVTVQ